MRHRACRCRGARHPSNGRALSTGGGFAGEWTYTTVLARTRSGLRLPTTANEESHELRWVGLDEVEKLPLIAPFRHAFPALRRRVEKLNR